MSQLQVTGEAKVRDIQGPVVANSGVITALDGDASQYVRGDGTLADFPTSTGGGSSVSYYLNSSVSQGTIGGVAYRQLGKTPIIGAGTDITISANGYVASYITDANDPALLEVPAGNFNCEFYFSVNSNNHNPYVYAEVYKYDGTTFSLIGTSVGVPEYLSNGTTLSPYYFAIPVATAALTITDRLAIRIYVNVDGRTVTLHTENGHLCQVVTTFSKGLTSLNNLTRQVQFLATGTSGTDFNISSSTATHTFNLPIASATNTGKLSSSDWSVFNAKQAALSFTAPLVNTSNTISIPVATSLVDGYLDNLDWVKFNTAYNDSIISAAVTGTTTKTLTLNQQDGGTITASWTDDNTDAVTSVFGRTGAVVATSGDYNTSQVTELTNLYFTDARSRAALSFAAGSGAYNSTTGVITIPTNNNQITNGSNFITLTSLSAGAGISYNNTTGAISSTITQYTDALARASISLTTTGTSGAATYNSTTGILNVPNYGSALSGYLPLTGGTLSTTNSTETLRINNSGSGYSLYVQTNSYFQGDLTLQGSLKSAFHTFILPNASGTLALTSQIPSLSGYVEGTGTTNYLPKFTGASTIGNSNLINDASGNLGLGVTPSAWGGGFNAYQVNVAAIRGSGFTTGLSHNAYFNGTSFLYINSGVDVTDYYQNGGSHVWRTAPSGTSGNAITFTQAMTLNASGNLSLGNTTAASTTTPISISLGGTYGTTLANGTKIKLFDNGSVAHGIGAISGNLYLNTNDATDITFNTNNAERIRIFSDGNVGIATGNTNAGYKLDVNGTGRFSGALDVRNANSYFGSVKGYVYILEDQINSYFSSNAEATLNINYYGYNQGFTQFRNFNIYNGKGSSILFLSGSTGAATFSSSVTANSTDGISGKFVSNTFFGSIDLENTGGTATGKWNLQAVSGAQVGGSAGSSFGIYSYGASAYRMFINSSGYVGIGATSPVARLTIDGDYADMTGTITYSTNTRGIVINQDAGGGYGTGIWFRQAGLTAGIGSTRVSGGDWATDLRFYTHPSSTTNQNTLYERMRINSEGNVGIATTVPSSLLTLQSPNNLNGNLITLYNFSNAADSYVSIGSYYGNGNTNVNSQVRFGNENPSGGASYLAFATGPSITPIERMRITSGGNVLIGTTTDAGYKLDVNGTGRFRNELYVTGANNWELQSYSDGNLYINRAGVFSALSFNGSSGAATFSSSVTATSFFESSDSRLKILVKDYEQPKGIENVAARMYVKNSKQELGYYAQDLQEILPSAVSEGEDGFLNLSYSQVHTAKIAYLEEKVAQLEELIKSLKIN